MKTDRRPTNTLDTAAKRARLRPSKNPIFIAVGGNRQGISLGYRKPLKGAGSWVVKLIVNKRRAEERLAAADDANAPPDALSYAEAVQAALTWATRTAVSLEAEARAGSGGGSLTVESAVRAYIAAREQNAPATAHHPRSRLSTHVLSDSELSSIRLSRLAASDLLTWRRKRLSPKLAPATVNRLLNDLRAALNAAATEYRRQLPAGIFAEIKAGLKALPLAEEARQQILSDSQIRDVIAAARELDADGDFSRLVLLAAATGARFSQLAKLKVGSVQAEQLRIMVPVSAKGRGSKARSVIPVAVGQDVVDQLRCVMADRPADAPLLERWRHQQVKGAQWVRASRGPWQSASETLRLWKDVAAKAELPAGAIMYSLRHSSVVRQLRRNVPIRIVAAHHDTSVAMIEKHYAAYISEATEDIVRAAIIELA